MTETLPSMSNRTARLAARIAPDALAVVKRAAEIQGQSVSDFVVEAARQAAVKAIEEASIIRLSLADQLLISKAILEPPEPNDALRRAFAAHGKIVVAAS